MIFGGNRISSARALVGILVVASGVPFVGMAYAAGVKNPSPVPPSVSPNTSSRFATDQLIVKMKDGSVPNLASLMAEAGEKVQLKRVEANGAWVGKLGNRRSERDMQTLAAKISALPGVAYAEPDAIMVPLATPTDPNYGAQWDLVAPVAGKYGANLPTAWDTSTGTSDVVVAVIDTGITNHADLAGQTVPGYDMISDPLVANDGDGRDADPSDPGDWVTSADTLGYFAGCGVSNSSWHGTHVAGTIAALQNNGIGITGIAPGVKVEPVRVLGKCGGYTSDIADALRWAAGLNVPGVPANANPASVLSLSLGGTGACPATIRRPSPTSPPSVRQWSLRRATATPTQRASTPATVPASSRSRPPVPPVTAPTTATSAPASRSRHRVATPR
jgi:serine protease